jgi:hypothetical protein
MITDIIRSIHSRCELLCEDIEVIEEEGNTYSTLYLGLFLVKNVQSLNVVQVPVWTNQRL